MTVKEAAKELDVSLWRVWQLCVVGVIPSLRSDGRILIRPEDLEAYSLAFPT